MLEPKIIWTKPGEELVVLSRADYDVLCALADEALVARYYSLQQKRRAAWAPL